jgi:hypothetical protein
VRLAIIAWSIAMLTESTMHEALARERMRSTEYRARQARLSAHVAAARRWHRLERMARRAHARHEERAQRALQALGDFRQS